MSDALTVEAVEAATRRWLERAVIGLNLCPFARAPYVKGRVRIVVSQARDEESLLVDMCEELQRLAVTEEESVETTLLVHPHVLGDFLEFNDFLDLADAALARMNLEGEFQVASFHPDYEFADAPVGDVANFTNRSPYPTLHLLRESSIERAVEAVEDTDAIYERNIARLRELGVDGWNALWRDAG
ncbi:DUF1415 domain-containing protein [Xanthomonadaceae bacterium JHOS43]|nr:DUF1415 domain-containing protein [Xanthomonadaceae bacterium JHOS43]MCX7562927.1 DUF1415 domain-containing protein [Xanthomonadaceae bacterium XH05]